MDSSKSREHRVRVLENQERIAAELAQRRLQQGNKQAQMPLVVAVMGSHKPRQPYRRLGRVRLLPRSTFDEF
jgi:hypothetical protein